MIKGLLLLLCVAVWYCESKPVQDVLPHSRDYYAGYVKAITDNFDQLFKNERRPRSVDEVATKFYMRIIMSCAPNPNSATIGCRISLQGDHGSWKTSTIFR